MKGTKETGDARVLVTSGVREETDEMTLTQDDDLDTNRSRSRGRPRVIEGPSSSVSVHLSTATHDRLVELSRRRGESVSSYIREVLMILTGTRSG